MECPLCQSSEHVEVDLHADGFSQNACECGDCGEIWTSSGGSQKIIKQGHLKEEAASPGFACPICKNSEHVEVDLHADGFAQDACECGDCGSIWTYVGDALKVIKGGNPPGETRYANFVCPTCKTSNSIETSLDAFQFHEELHECSFCGTTSSSAHDQLEVVKDSQAGSFLSSVTDLVEADDYAFV